MGEMMQVPCTHWYCRQHLRVRLYRSMDAIPTGHVKLTLSQMH